MESCCLLYLFLNVMLMNWEQSMALPVVMFPGSLWFEHVWKLKRVCVSLDVYNSPSKHLWTCQQFFSDYCCVLFTSQREYDATRNHSWEAAENQEITLSSILSTAVERWEVPCSAMGWVRMSLCCQPDLMTSVCLRMPSIFWCQSGQKWHTSVMCIERYSGEHAYIHDFIHSSTHPFVYSSLNPSWLISLYIYIFCKTRLIIWVWFLFLTLSPAMRNATSQAWRTRVAS